MVDVPLDMYLVTVTAVDQTRQNEILKATFRLIANDGAGPRTEDLSMYDADRRPVRHAVAVDPNDPTTFTWLIMAQNLVGDPVFTADYHLDVTNNQVLRGGDSAKLLAWTRSAKAASDSRSLA
ncbi:hypothetical protein ACQKGC_28550 [Allorhizobium pseudoryzae]|uniref:hypothetical protein n=1 Tax=Allorhizobium pseudoryzae TaxID=379684 RepID=UPI003CFE4952